MPLSSTLSFSPPSFFRCNRDDTRHIHTFFTARAAFVTLLVTPPDLLAADGIIFLILYTCTAKPPRADKSLLEENCRCAVFTFSRVFPLWCAIKNSRRLPSLFIRKILYRESFLRGVQGVPQLATVILTTYSRAKRTKVLRQGCRDCNTFRMRDESGNIKFALGGHRTMIKMFLHFYRAYEIQVITTILQSLIKVILKQRKEACGKHDHVEK